MRVFLCNFRGFSLAIPMDSVSFITQHQKNTERAIEYKAENHNTYVSLPRLFKLPLLNVRHGIILKDGNADEDNGTIENKMILLTTKVECETEIPEKIIFPIPKTLEIMRFSFLFNGIIFNSHTGDVLSVSSFTQEDLILLFNPEKLTKNIKRKLKHDKNINS
ncbi:MAG: hypothetical protein LBQ89_05530 [Treponema sp.]|jgi:hypothetical protein|nr:hypothetical protein [Treponema sp.]